MNSGDNLGFDVACKGCQYTYKVSLVLKMGIRDWGLGVLVDGFEMGLPWSLRFMGRPSLRGLGFRV